MAKTLVKTMGFAKRAATTGRPDIPEGAKKKAEIIFLHQIVELVEENNIRPSLIMNSDQTPLKYAPVYSQTLAEKGPKNVGISGMTYRKLLTATFGITFSNTLLPIQLIYGGKTTQSIPRTKSLESFFLSANVKHFSKTTKSIKSIYEIILPYVEGDRRRLDSEGQPA